VFTLTFGGTDITEHVVSLKQSRPFNGRNTLDLTINLYTAPDLCPPGYGDYAGQVRQHKIGEQAPEFELKITVADQSRFTYYLPGQPSTNGDLLTWKCVDVSSSLAADGASMSDIIREAGNYRTAHDVMKEIASDSGLALACEFPDYQINEFRRGGGNKLNWLDELGKQMQAFRRPWRKGLKYQSYPGKLAAPRWQFVDEKNIEDLTLEEAERPRNQFKASRMLAVTGVAGEKDGTGPNVVGRQSVDLETPSKYANVQVLKVVNGGLVDLVWKGQDGEVLSSGPPVYSGPQKAYKLEFTYLPSIVNFAWVPHYELLIRGGQTPAAQDEPFDFEVTDSASVAAVGLNPESGNLESTILYKPEDVLKAVQAALAASVIRAWHSNLKTAYLNPEVDPGDVCSVTDAATRQTGRLWFIDNVEDEFAEDQSWTQTLKLVGPDE